MTNKVMEKRILEFISEYSNSNNVTPSFRKIGAAVGLKSSSSVSRYIEHLKDEGKLLSVNQKGQVIMLARRVEFHETECQTMRVCLEFSDGGVAFIDCSLEKRINGIASVSFSGILDASQMKGRIGQVVSCRVDDSK